MPGIFISYRREDSAGHAGRLSDRLATTFGRDRVFMDVEAIEAGVDFVEAIERAVASCDVLLAVIGREWLGSKDESGRRRLDQPGDFIRIEIAAALDRNVRVVPVLVRGGAMPDADALPQELRRLTRRQAVELRDTRWDADVEHLVATLQRALASTPVDQGADAVAPRPHPDVASQAPSASEARQAARQWRARPIVAAMLGVLLIGAVLLQFGSRLFRRDPSPGPTPVPTTTTTDTLITVPTLVGLGVTEAGQRIAAAGLKLSITDREATKAVAPGTVIRQTPAAGDKLSAGKEVMIVIAVRVAPPQETRIQVPNVVGQPLKDAAERIQNAGFIVGSRTTGSRQGAAPFEVLTQTPAGGALADRGERIDLVYATDVRRLPAPVPDTPTCGSRIARPSNKFIGFGWKPVPGATSYTVEVDCLGCAGRGWFSARGTPWHVRTNLGLRSPIYSSDLGSAPGSALRWRVWAVDRGGERGEMSNWCQLTFE
jgi:TIR domain/PASTA domain